MKKNVWIFGVVIVAFGNSLIGQKISQSESELKSLLCKQWEIEFAMIGDMKIDQLPGATDFDFKFRPDGTYDTLKDNGDTTTGSWKFYSDEKYVELEINGTKTSRIEFLTGNKLVLIMTPEDSGPPGMDKIEAHFKPMK